MERQNAIHLPLRLTCPSNSLARRFRKLIPLWRKIIIWNASNRMYKQFASKKLRRNIIHDTRALMPVQFSVIELPDDRHHCILSSLISQGENRFHAQELLSRMRRIVERADLHQEIVDRIMLSEAERVLRNSVITWFVYFCQYYNSNYDKLPFNILAQ